MVVIQFFVPLPVFESDARLSVMFLLKIRMLLRMMPIVRLENMTQRLTQTQRFCRSLVKKRCVG